jgi:hypothetical protein
LKKNAKNWNIQILDGIDFFNLHANPIVSNILNNGNMCLVGQEMVPVSEKKAMTKNAASW